MLPGKLVRLQEARICRDKAWSSPLVVSRVWQEVFEHFHNVYPQKGVLDVCRTGEERDEEGEERVQIRSFEDLWVKCAI